MSIYWNYIISRIMYIYYIIASIKYIFSFIRRTWERYIWDPMIYNYNITYSLYKIIFWYKFISTSCINWIITFTYNTEIIWCNIIVISIRYYTIFSRITYRFCKSTIRYMIIYLIIIYIKSIFTFTNSTNTRIYYLYI